MANVIIRDEGRQAEVDHVLKSYGMDRSDPSMREAAEVIAARTDEAIREGNKERRYY